MLQYGDGFVAEVGHFYDVRLVVVGMEDGEAACSGTDVVVFLEDVAIDAHLQGVVPVGGVGDVADGCECLLSEAADGVGLSVVEDFVAALPVVDGEHAVFQIEEVECSRDAAVLVEDSPLGAVGCEMALLGEAEEELIGVVGLVGQSEVVAFYLLMHLRAEGAGDLAFACPPGLELLGGEPEGGGFLLCPVVGVELLETTLYNGGDGAEHLSVNRIDVLTGIEVQAAVALVAVELVIIHNSQLSQVLKLLKLKKLRS